MNAWGHEGTAKVSGFGFQEGKMAEKTCMAVEDLEVYRKLCQGDKLPNRIVFVARPAAVCAEALEELVGDPDGA